LILREEETSRAHTVRGTEQGRGRGGEKKEKQARNITSDCSRRPWRLLVTVLLLLSLATASSSSVAGMASAGGCLYLVGLGLGDEKDITVKGLETVRRCKGIFLEGYTSILGVDVKRLEEFYERPVTLMDREAVESECDGMLELATKEEVAFLVVGDVYGATTHTDMAVRAKELGIKVRVIHNASIMNACSACGLQLYNFGQTVSICFFTETWKPDSFIDKVVVNKKAGMHTLALLDIKVKEQSEENMARGRKIYEPPRSVLKNLEPATKSSIPSNLDIILKACNFLAVGV
jgi:diphthine synthase